MMEEVTLMNVGLLLMQQQMKIYLLDVLLMLTLTIVNVIQITVGMQMEQVFVNQHVLKEANRRILLMQLFMTNVGLTMETHMKQMKMLFRQNLEIL
jgi:hypothetical protein